MLPILAPTQVPHEFRENAIYYKIVRVQDGGGQAVLRLVLRIGSEELTEVRRHEWRQQAVRAGLRPCLSLAVGISDADAKLN